MKLLPTFMRPAAKLPALPQVAGGNFFRTEELTHDAAGKITASWREAHLNDDGFTWNIRNAAQRPNTVNTKSEYIVEFTPLRGAENLGFFEAVANLAQFATGQQGLGWIPGAPDADHYTEIAHANGIIFDLFTGAPVDARNGHPSQAGRFSPEELTLARSFEKSVATLPALARPQLPAVAWDINLDARFGSQIALQTFANEYKRLIEKTIPKYLERSADNRGALTKCMLEGSFGFPLSGHCLCQRPSPAFWIKEVFNSIKKQKSLAVKLPEDARKTVLAVLDDLFFTFHVLWAQTSHTPQDYPNKLKKLIAHTIEIGKAQGLPPEQIVQAHAQIVSGKEPVLPQRFADFVAALEKSVNSVNPDGKPGPPYRSTRAY